MSELSELKDHLIILTKGKEDGGKSAVLGLKLAVTLQSMNRNISIFLTLGATIWSLSKSGENIQLPDELTLEEYFEFFLENGGELLVCAPCIEAYCCIPPPAENGEELQRKRKAKYVGLATVAEKLINGHATLF